MTAQRPLSALVFIAFVLASPLLRATEAPTGDYFAHRLVELDHELQGDIASPRAAATVYRIAALCDDVPDLAPLTDLLSRAAKDSRALPEVRALATNLLADIELARNHLDRTVELRASLGFASDGWLLGGFDNEGGAGHSTPYGPEKGPIDLKASYSGKETDISWQRMPPSGLSDVIPVTDLLRPRKNATFYFLTTLDLPAAQAVALHLGSSGYTKVWVNGQLISEDTDDHPARFDQHTVAVNLLGGANVILVKVSTLDETPALVLRTTDLAGERLKQAKFVAPPISAPVHVPAVLATSPEAGPATPTYEDISAQLKKLIADHPDDASLHEDYATILSERRPFDSKQQLHRRQQEQAVALAPKNARAQLRLGGYIDDDQNARRQAYEAALVAEPAFAPARAQLSSYYLDRGFVRRGYDEAVRAAADDPSYYPARLVLARALAALGLDARGKHLELELPSRFPTTPAVLLAAARTERSLGRLDRAEALYRQVLDLRHDMRDARGELLAVLMDSSRIRDALALLREEQTFHPTSIWTGLRLADLLSFNGDPQEAQAEYDTMAELAPKDDSIFESRGQHFLRHGDTVRAVQDFQTALAIKPQNAHLEELVRSIHPQEDFAGPYLRDAAALAAQAHAKPPPADEESVTLANVDVVQVFANGLSSRVHQQVIQVLNDRGVDHNRVVGLQYSPDGQQIRVEQARVIKQDGSVFDAKTESDQALTDSWAGMYFDYRQHTIAFPNVQPGDVIELRYRRDDTSQENMFADYFGDVSFLQGTSPNKDVEYVLIAPAERALYANEPRLPNVQHTEEKTADGKQILRWRVTDVPKIEPEPRMPGWADVAAYLHVSTFKEWDDVARYWWGLVHEQLHVTPEVAKAAEEAVAGIPASDVRGRVRAVYDYVVTKTRYVGLEFGIHGFKPYTVDRILARRFGDCKDKASLMYAMLSHLGIESNLVLLRMRNLGHLNDRPASLAVFNHCILYVPALNAYLDGTAEFSGSGELPSVDQGAQVLVVQHDGRTRSNLAVTPVSSAGDNVISHIVTIALAGDGSAKLDGKAHVDGAAAQDYRRMYESETGRRERFEQNYARSFPGAHATEFDIGDPHAIEKPVETRFALTVPRLARNEGGALVFFPLGEPMRFVQSYAGGSKRVFPVELGAPWRHELSSTVRIPASFALADAPVSLRKSSPFGSYEYTEKMSPDGLVVTGFVSLAVDKVPPDQYDAFRAFLEDMDRVFSRQLHLAPSSHLSEASR